MEKRRDGKRTGRRRGPWKCKEGKKKNENKTSRDEGKRRGRGKESLRGGKGMGGEAV